MAKIESNASRASHTPFPRTYVHIIWYAYRLGSVQYICYVHTGILSLLVKRFFCFFHQIVRNGCAVSLNDTVSSQGNNSPKIPIMVLVSVARAKNVVAPPRRPFRYLSLPVVGVIMIMASSTQSFLATITRRPFQTKHQTHDPVVQPHDTQDYYPAETHDIINGTDVLFAVPENVRGILFVAHGCSHSHTDWFLGCEGCIGLPEERAIVVQALELGLVVIAISSTNRVSMCWDPRRDVEPLGLVLQEMARRYGSTLPILLFGASSGGAFVSAAATPLVERFGLAVSGFISQIAAIEVPNDTTKCRVYITMNKDERTDVKAASLTKNVRPPSKTQHIRLPPLPILDDYFATRIPEISMDQSSKLTSLLKQNGLLDDADFLRESPRNSNWRGAIKPLLPLSGLERDQLEPDRSPISEVMNVAEGVHEMTRDGVKEALEFCLLAPSS